MIISSGFKGEQLMDEEILATMNSFRSASLVFSSPENFIAIVFGIL